MSRLVSDGAEHRVAPTATANPIGGPGYLLVGSAPSIDTAGAMRGKSTAAWKATTSLTRTRWTMSGALATDYWSRTYFIFDAQGLTGTLGICEWQDSSNVQLALVRINNTTLTLQARSGAGAADVGSPSTALTTGVWYCLETHINVNVASGTNDTFEAWLDGVLFASSAVANLGTTAPNFYLCGPATLTGTVTIRWDDVAINSSAAGTGQTGRCGPGSIAHIQPASDNARTGWTAGAGGTTSLNAAVNKSPPVGVVNASATNTSQIHDSVSNTTDTYDANLTDYTTAGITGVVKLVEARAVVGNSTITTRNIGVQMVSNPAIAEVVQATGTTAAATYPTGWTGYSIGTAYAPSITPGTGPVMRVRKATASTDAANCCAMFLLVEFSMELPLGTAAGVATAQPVLLGMFLGSATGVAAGASVTAITTGAPMALGSAAASATGTLAVTAAGGATPVTLVAAAATCSASASFQLSASLVLSSAAGVGAGTLALTVAPKLVCGTAAGVAAAGNVLLSSFLGTAAGVASDSLALRIPAPLTVGTAAGVAAPTIALTVAPTLVCAAATASATGTLVLAAALTLSTAVASATATLALTVATPVTLVAATSTAASSGTLTLTVAPKLVCTTAAASASGTLGLTIPAPLTCGTSAATGGGTLTVTAIAGALVSPATATAIATGTLTLKVAVTLTPSSAAGVASTRNVLLSSWANTATSSATGTLVLTVRPFLALGASANASATLQLRVAPTLACGTATGSSSGANVLPAFWLGPAAGTGTGGNAVFTVWLTASPASATATGSLALTAPFFTPTPRWPPSTDQEWALVAGEEWPGDTDDGWALGVGDGWQVVEELQRW